jgi:general secretion pathway protein K
MTPPPWPDPMKRLPPPLVHAPSDQRGAALLTAMIIVTLVATLAASMVWQQWRAVRVEAGERARAQSAWILAGALDWARLILKEDGRNPQMDHLGEPWAVPLAEARLSTFLAADQSNTDDAPDAFLSGSISDAQARYNLMNLVKSDGTLDDEQAKVLIRLCETIHVSSDVATRIATALAGATIANKAQSTEAAAPLIPHTIAQLAWLGIAPDAIRALSPYVVLLESSTPVKLNANTASREVLAAVIGIDLSRAERLVQLRQRTPFSSLAPIQTELSGVDLSKANLDVKSSFFEVRGRLRLETHVLEQISLVQRIGQSEVRVLRRERVSSLDQPAS